MVTLRNNIFLMVRWYIRHFGDFCWYYSKLGSTNGQHSRRTSHVNNPGDPVHTVPSITCTRVETHHDQATSHRRVSDHPTPGKMPKRPRARSTTIELAHKVRCKYFKILHSKRLMNAILKSKNCKHCVRWGGFQKSHETFSISFV